MFVSVSYKSIPFQAKLKMEKSMEDALKAGNADVREKNHHDLLCPYHHHCPILQFRLS